MSKSDIYRTPPTRRRKWWRRPQPVVKPTQMSMRVNGKWETFESKAELVAFMEARKGGRE